MTAEQIAQTIADLTTAMTSQRPTVTNSSCTCAGCAACAKGGRR